MAPTIISTDNTASTTIFNTANLDIVVNATLSAAPAMFLDNGAGGASVIVNGSLIGSGANNTGLTAFRTLQLINNGTISGLAGIAFSPSNHAIFGTDKPTVIVNNGTILARGFGRAAIEDNLDSDLAGASSEQRIFNSGQIIGDIGLNLGSKDSLIENGGLIRGALGVAVVAGDDNDVVRNWGMIDGAVLLGDGSNKVENSGTITLAVSMGSGNDRLTNTGTINVSVDLGAGFNVAINHGVIGGSVVAGNSSDGFENHGTILGQVLLGDGDGNALNTGIIGSSIGFGASADHLSNSGTILGTVSMGNGSNFFLNTGTVQGEIFFGTGADSVSNGGSLMDDLLMGAGNDSYFTFENGLAFVVLGGAGNDTLRGGVGVDHFEGDADNDTLDGGGGNDSLLGGAGLDTLNGGLGADDLDGGTEVDTASYEGAVGGIVASLADVEANIGEAAGDTYVSIEALIGSAFADTLIGDGGTNTLQGGKGKDHLFGGDGALDSLLGGNGDDVLDGGTGGDILSGEAGSDTYIVDSASDLIVESSANTGSDAVLASTSYALDGAAHIELIRANAVALALTGNGFAQLIEGSVGKDTLVGGGGADTLIGGAGKDQLTGGAAADRFVFNTALAKSNVDAVTSFTHDLDLIALDDAIFARIGPSLQKVEFFAGAGATKAHDKDDRIIYDKKTGKLFYDDDGNKAGGHAAIHFATLANKPVLDHGDFIIV
jgi:Ca2+-binding RTX toxin-like protein